MSRRVIRSSYTSRATEDLAEDRELAAQQAAPAKPSQSSTLRRCRWCREWRSPDKNDRCTHCRQRIGTEPLQGLKRVA